MKYVYRAVLILFACIIASGADARDTWFEVQYGAFTLRTAAQECAQGLGHLDRPVYISLLRNNGGKQYYTVRTGPFKSVEQARAYIENSDPDLSDEPWIMVRNSLEPAEEKPRTAGRPASSGDGAPKAVATPAVSEPEEVRVEPAQADVEVDLSAQAEEPEDPGLWGAGEDVETESGLVPVPEAVPASEYEDLKRQLDELQDQVQALLDAEEVRGALEESEEDREEQEEEILSAAGRNYTLLRKGKLGFEYKFDYTYYSYDAIRESIIIEHNSNHNITNTFTLELPVKDNFSLEADIPFVFVYEDVGGDNSRDVSDFGDVRFSANYQPFRSGGGLPSMIFRTTLTTPMGRSPYDINRQTELSTGSGGYALEGSVYLSKVLDPVVVYGSFGYNYKFPIDDLNFKLASGGTLDEYERGDTITFALGMAYSLSYTTSLSLGYSYAYTLESKAFFREGGTQEYPTQSSSSLSIGTSWRLSPKLLLNVTLGIGIADSDHHSISFRFPFEFDL